jgi:hypothetical protein
MTCGEVMVFIYHELTPKFFLISTVAKMVVGIIPIVRLSSGSTSGAWKL